MMLNPQDSARRQDRKEQMVSMLVGGSTLEEVGHAFGVSRQRVKQITGNDADLRFVRRDLDGDIYARTKRDARADKSLRSWWRHVVAGDGEASCWEWDTPTDRTETGGGYGRFVSRTLFGDEEAAHRQAFYLSRGYFPKRPMMVLHSCNNPACVRHDHLYEGTAKDNTADAIRIRNGVHWSTAHTFSLD